MEHQKEHAISLHVNSSRKKSRRKQKKFGRNNSVVTVENRRWLDKNKTVITIHIRDVSVVSYDEWEIKNTRVWWKRYQNGEL